MNDPYNSSGWCHWHHAPAGTLALIAVAPTAGARDLHACAECRTTYRLTPAVTIPAEVRTPASEAPTPSSLPVTPCVAGGHDFPVEDEAGAYCPEHGVEVQRVPQQPCEPHRLLRALAETAGEAAADG